MFGSMMFTLGTFGGLSGAGGLAGWDAALSEEFEAIDISSNWAMGAGANMGGTSTLIAPKVASVSSLCDFSACEDGVMDTLGEPIGPLGPDPGVSTGTAMEATHLEAKSLSEFTSNSFEIASSSCKAAVWHRARISKVLSSESSNSARANDSRMAILASDRKPL